ncbi:MAG: HDIG domain-containing protein [Anaerolineae bacterium]|nr:HDIG domain-containing protein [Anaerolineae bacterium]MDW8102135.1 HDIG domain-containing protein [Anaerolineae bacterium]
MEGKLFWPELARKVGTILLFFSFAILITLILTWEPGARAVNLKLGDVSPYDIRSPRKLSYVSQVLTEKARAQAEASVEEIYDPPDPSIARRQLAKATAVINFVEAVRSDPYGTPEEKKLWLASMEGITLTEEIISALLSIPEPRWEMVSGEILSVLERAMRSEIRQDRLLEVRRAIPAMVSWDLSEEEAKVVASIAGSLVSPNSFINYEKTEEAKKLAREAVKPVIRSVEKGEVITRAGSVVGPLELEAMEALGLNKPSFCFYKFLGAFALASTATVGLAFYLSNSRTPLLLIFASFLTLAKFISSGQGFLPYLLPVASCAALLFLTAGKGLAMAGTLVLSILSGYMAGVSLELVSYWLASSSLFLLMLGKGDRLNLYLHAGLASSFGGFGTILAFRLPWGNPNPTEMAFLGGIAFINGIISVVLTLGSSFVLGSFLGSITPLHLVELSRPTHPLLRLLLLRAPGTYHHSLLVANIAEQAAENIGANALLTRVGAYYHDVGKSLHPYFFVENQMNGVNAHRSLDPRTSARIIVSHVKDGLDLARKYRLPQQIQDFIAQHHGTDITPYFYHEECKRQNGSVGDDSCFRYPGPRPRTRETAIVMLADSCEAAVRAARPSSPEEVEKIVRRVIKDKLDKGELDESGLTLKEIEEIRKTFITALQGVFHPRIQYPEQEEGDGKG